ncbi:MAG: hypothetical protein ACI96M_001658 [Candidatus Azotimanducaceae bacterium]|jgi:hypothetical protein
MFEGSCLCESVRFQVLISSAKVYQCFCALCRKASGSQSNSAFIVAEQKFNWACDQATISSYMKPTGFRSDFCATCGSPVPNQLRNRPFFWIPAGLMDKTFNAVITTHIFTPKSPDWTLVKDGVTKHSSMPNMDEFIFEVASSE